MGTIDSKSIQDAYKKEARSLIKKISKELSFLNSQRNTANGIRYTEYGRRLFSLFRYAHTLKGISGTCGDYKIEEIAKSVTEIFQTAKDGKFEISPKDKIMIMEKLKTCEEFIKK
ncbi:MAG: Hpt domain-containing protein [Candidatus Omnitrophota bacterium]